MVASSATPSFLFLSTVAVTPVKWNSVLNVSVLEVCSSVRDIMSHITLLSESLAVCDCRWHWSKLLPCLSHVSYTACPGIVFTSSMSQGSLTNHCDCHCVSDKQSSHPSAADALFLCTDVSRIPPFSVLILRNTGDHSASCSSAYLRLRRLTSARHKDLT